MRRRLIEFIVLAALAIGAGPVSAAIWNWSTTAGSNATADPSINWSEGMSPSSVNDSARAMMAAIAAWRNDISAVNTSGGTAAAYTVTTSEGVNTTPADGQMLSFVAHATNTANATLQADGGTAYSIKLNGAAIGAGVIVSGTPYRVSFKSSAWNLEAGYGNPYNIPLGGYLETSVSSAPNSNFVAADGSCISRTTYSAYFALVSTTYGACDGTTTFAVPDRRGRVSAMLDGGAGRLTNASGGCGTVFNTLGTTCGGESVTLTLAQLPTGITSSGNNNIAVLSTPAVQNTATGNSAQGGGGLGIASFITQVYSTGVNNISVTSNNTSGSAHRTVQPTFGVNVFVRIF